MKCPNCGFESDVNYCCICGTEIPETQCGEDDFKYADYPPSYGFTQVIDSENNSSMENSGEFSVLSPFASASKALVQPPKSSEVKSNLRKNCKRAVISAVSGVVAIVLVAGIVINIISVCSYDASITETFKRIRSEYTDDGNYYEDYDDTNSTRDYSYSYYSDDGYADSYLYRLNEEALIFRTDDADDVTSDSESFVYILGDSGELSEAEIAESPSYSESVLSPSYTIVMKRITAENVKDELNVEAIDYTFKFIINSNVKSTLKYELPDILAYDESGNEYAASEIDCETNTDGQIEIKNRYSQSFTLTYRIPADNKPKELSLHYNQNQLTDSGKFNLDLWFYTDMTDITNSY